MPMPDVEAMLHAKIPICPKTDLYNEDAAEHMAEAAMPGEAAGWPCSMNGQSCHSLRFPGSGSYTLEEGPPFGDG